MITSHNAINIIPPRTEWEKLTQLTGGYGIPRRLRIGSRRFNAE
jgi:hypothetical protein